MLTLNKETKSGHSLDDPSAKCFKCGKMYKSQKLSFYRMGSSIYEYNNKRATVCMKCMEEVYEDYKQRSNTDKEAFYYYCLKFDIYFNEEIYDEVKENVLLSRIVHEYNKKLMNTRGMSDKCFTNTFEDKKKRPTEGAIYYTGELKVYSGEWFGSYTQEELEYLDKYYAGLKRDYKIVTENHKDYARKIAMASLYMNKAFQDLFSGKTTNMDAMTKARDTFDNLCKSAKFSEQSRGINDVSLGSFGVIVDRVENEMWIPKHTPIDKDDVDKIIEYFGSIKNSL